MVRCSHWVLHVLCLSNTLWMLKMRFSAIPIYVLQYIVLGSWYRPRGPLHVLRLVLVIKGMLPVKSLAPLNPLIAAEYF